MSDEENKIPNNRTYIINKEKKEIIAYPIERKILYAIAKIEKKDKIIKEDYFVIDKTLSELINVGNNMLSTIISLSINYIIQVISIVVSVAIFIPTSTFINYAFKH